MKKVAHGKSASILAATLAVAVLAGCAVTVALRDDRLSETLAFLDRPETTRASVVAHIGEPDMEDRSWLRYESRGGLLPAVSRRTLVVTFGDAGYVSEYRYLGVSGCAMPPILGVLPTDEALAEVCREGVTKAEVISRLNHPISVRPQTISYATRTGNRMAGRVITFDESGRFKRLTRTALALSGDETAAGADINENAFDRLVAGLSGEEVRDIMGAPQMVSGNVWGYCATAPGSKQLLVARFSADERLSESRLIAAAGAHAGETSACYVCHSLSMGPTCLDCHALDEEGG